MIHSECSLCRKLLAVPQLPPDEVLWHFPHSVAFLGPWQYYQGYCVLVARRHATELHHLNDQERQAFLEEMCLLARAVHQCFQPLKLNYEMLGNQVPHLHWHIFPRYSHDSNVLKSVWLALEQAEHDPEERRRLQHSPLSREATAAALRDVLSQGTPSQP